MNVFNFGILYLIYFKLCHANIFVLQRFTRTKECSGKPGCPLDAPNEVFTGISRIFECVFKCMKTTSCVNFSYQEIDFFCKLFYTSPYKLLATNSCLNYDVTQNQQSYQGNVNLAYHRRTCQSTTILDKHPWYAVDGNASVPDSTCAHTNEGDSGNNWFMVDLLKYVIVNFVRVLARQGNIGIRIRYKNLTIGVTNSSWLEKTPVRNTYPLCGVYLGPPVSAEWLQVNCTSEVPPARYVIVHQVRVYSISGGYLSICEIEVHGTL